MKVDKQAFMMGGDERCDDTVVQQDSRGDIRRQGTDPPPHWGLPSPAEDDHAILQGPAQDELEMPEAPGYKLLSVYLSVLLDSMGAMMVVPLLPFLAEKMHGTPFQVGLMQAIYSFTQVFGSMALGAFSDVIGKRKVLLLSLLLSSIFLTAFGLAGNLFYLMLFRGAHGFFAGTVSVCQAIVADVTTTDERAGKMALIMAAYGVGVVAGPALTGFLADRGFPFVCFTAAALTFSNFVLASCQLQEVPAQEISGELNVIEEEESTSLCSNVRLVVTFMCSDKTIACMNIINLAQNVIMGAFLGVVALLAKDAYGVTAAGLGEIYCVAGVTMVIFQGLVTQPAVRTIGELWCIVIGSIVRVGALVLMTCVTAPWVPWLSPVCIVAAGALIDPCTASLVSKSTTESNSGVVLGAFSAMASFGSFIGPLGAGYLYGRSPQSPFFVCAIISGVCALILLPLLFKARREGSGASSSLGEPLVGHTPSTSRRKMSKSTMRFVRSNRTNSLALPLPMITMADPECQQIHYQSQDGSPRRNTMAHHDAPEDGQNRLEAVLRRRLTFS